MSSQKHGFGISAPDVCFIDGTQSPDDELNAAFLVPFKSQVKLFVFSPKYREMFTMLITAIFLHHSG